MKKLFLIGIAVLFVGCASGFKATKVNSYHMKGGDIQIGMTASEVRAIAGVPNNISLKDGTEEMLYKGGLMGWGIMSDNRQYWYYGNPKTDRKEVVVTFAQGVVVRIGLHEYDANKG